MLFQAPQESRIGTEIGGPKPPVEVTSLGEITLVIPGVPVDPWNDGPFPLRTTRDHYDRLSSLLDLSVSQLS